jgi:hypothetical protein
MLQMHIAVVAVRQQRTHLALHQASAAQKAAAPVVQAVQRVLVVFSMIVPLRLRTVLGMQMWVTRMWQQQQPVVVVLSQAALPAKDPLVVRIHSVNHNKVVVRKGSLAQPITPSTTTSTFKPTISFFNNHVTN